MVGVLIIFGLGSLVGRKRTERRLKKGYTHVQLNSAYEPESESRATGFGKNTVIKKDSANNNNDDDDVLLGGSDDEDDGLVGARRNFNGSNA